jgi:hypothetical protein
MSEADLAWADLLPDRPRDHEHLVPFPVNLGLAEKPRFTHGRSLSVFAFGVSQNLQRRLMLGRRRLEIGYGRPIREIMA